MIPDENLYAPLSTAELRKSFREAPGFAYVLHRFIEYLDAERDADPEAARDWLVVSLCTAFPAFGRVLLLDPAVAKRRAFRVVTPVAER
jgi:hypothetical protein